MVRHRSHSVEFKRQVAQEFIAGETLHGLAKRYDVSRNLIRVWVKKLEAEALDEDARPADLLQECEAKIAALERMVGRQASEIEFLKGALRSAPRPRSATTSVVTSPMASLPPKTRYADDPNCGRSIVRRGARHRRPSEASRRTHIPGKKYAPEDIVAKLRQVDVLVLRGQNIADAIRQINVGEVTFYRWRREYQGLKTEHVKHLRELETENTRLRKATSGLTLVKLTNVPSPGQTGRDVDIAKCPMARNRSKRSARTQSDALLAYGSEKMRLRRVDRAFYLARDNQELARIERTAVILMAHIYQRKYEQNKIVKLIPTQDRKAFVTDIAPALDHKSECYRTRALVLTYCLIGIPIPLIARFLIKSRYKIQKLVQRYRCGNVTALLTRQSNGIKKSERKDIKDRLFAIMHAPPMDFDVNRTTWTIKLLKNILLKEGIDVGTNTLSAIIRAEGYHFRKTRAVLTSTDPEYRRKMKRITRILRRLGPDDRFFSVDEYGPFSIRQHGGRRRVRRGEYPTIPQYQRSLGYLIVTAALELSTNQVTHFFSKKKDTEEMITLMRTLIEQYSGCRRIYFSWDAASWHSSKRFLAEVRRVNKVEYRNANRTPMVKLAPLPCRAQFLNVIESVFNGMSISIIHNSDYESVDAAKAAINRYFGERNSYFKQNPERAGNKIWGDELVLSKFSESNNCKNPKLMSLANIGRRSTVEPGRL